MVKRLLSIPGGRVTGSHRVPGDKSISHRALLLAAVADGRTSIRNFLDGEDCLATANALRALGVAIESRGDEVVVQGTGELRPPAAALDLGNSGTGLRLLAGLLAGHDVSATLTGDASLRARPMRRVTQPLARMGARIETTPDGTAPLTVEGRSRLRGIDYAMPVASAQVKSAVLLAGLAAQEPVVVHEPAVTRDHTERLLRAFGATVSAKRGTVRLAPGARLRSPGSIVVPGDLSSAAFLFAAAAAMPGSAVTVENVGVNPTRDGVLGLLERLGAVVRIENRREPSGEPVADVTVEGGELRGIDIGPAEVALAIDEMPLLIALAALGSGETRIRGARELRVKESDRLAAMAAGLSTLGIDVTLFEDGMRIRGGEVRGGEVDGRGDHRIAMSFAILGQRAERPVGIAGCETIGTSFPGFVATMRAAGLDITERES